MTRVSKEFFSFFKSIASDIQENRRRHVDDVAALLFLYVGQHGGDPVQDALEFPIHHAVPIIDPKLL
jgi:hypothetical protein